MTLESNAPTALSARLAFIAERLRIHGAARFSASLTRLAAEAASLEASLARAEHRLDAIVGIAYDLETDDAPNVIPFPKEAAKKNFPPSPKKLLPFRQTSRILRLVQPTTGTAQRSSP